MTWGHQTDLVLPRTLGKGRYTVTELLGSGAMAVVHQVYDNHHEVWRAAKVLLPDQARRSPARRRFDAEIEALQEIDHRNVIRVTDRGEVNGLPYLIMELAEGGSLWDYCMRYDRPMPPRMACELMVQVCKGVGAAHVSGIVHRDIKPANVLLSRRGTAKVTDFGVARFAWTDGMTTTGAPIGTLGYMSPEQRNTPKQVDLRADVYALGATLYALLTRRVKLELFHADQEDEILEGIPEVLRQVILTATRYRPQDRFKDAGDLAKALFEARRHLDEDPADTPPLLAHIEALGPPPPVPDAESGEWHDGLAPTPPFLPYRVPAFDPVQRTKFSDPDPGSERLPEYVASPPADGSAQTASPLFPTPTPAPTSSPTPTDSQGQPKRSRVARNVAWVAAFATAAVILFVVTNLAAATASLRSAERATAETQQAVYALLLTESRALREIERLGMDHVTLKLAFDEVKKTNNEPDRHRAAQQYTALLRDMVQRAEDGQRDEAERRLVWTLHKRVQRIDEAFAAHDAARDRWQAADRGLFATVALSAGFASRARENPAHHK